jgi:hypothetical protein
MMIYFLTSMRAISNSKQRKTRLWRVFLFAVYSQTAAAQFFFRLESWSPNYIGDYFYKKINTNLVR